MAGRISGDLIVAVTGSLFLENHIAVAFGDVPDFYALTRLRALAGGHVEFVGMERADDLAGPTDAFGKRALVVWTTILGGKEAAVPLPEDGDFLPFHDVAPALAKRDFFNPAQVDSR